MLLFVYGTLKKGYGNNYLLEMAGADFVRKSVTKHKYYMISTGIPFVIEDNKIRQPEILKYKGHIVIEEYLIDKNRIHLIDELEGHPEWYTRKVVKDIEEYKGWLYFNRMNIEEYKDSLVKPDNKEIIDFRY